MQSAQSAFATVQLPGVHDSLRRSASARVHETLVWDEAVFEYDIRRSLLLVPASKSSGDEAEPADDGAPVERDEATRTWKRFGSGPGRLSHSASRYLRSGAAAGAKAVPRPMRLGLRRGRKSLMGWSSSTAATAPAAEEPDPIGEMVLSQRAISTLEVVLWGEAEAGEENYVGECSLRVPQWQPAGRQSIAWDASEPFWTPAISSADNSPVGEVQLRIGLVLPPAMSDSVDTGYLDELYRILWTANRIENALTLQSVPASEPVGMARQLDDFVDDGFDSDSDLENDEPFSDLSAPADEADSESDEDDEDEEGIDDGVAPEALDVPLTGVHPESDIRTISVQDLSLKDSNDKLETPAPDDAELTDVESTQPKLERRRGLLSVPKRPSMPKRFRSSRSLESTLENQDTTNAPVINPVQSNEAAAVRRKRLGMSRRRRAKRTQSGTDPAAAAAAVRSGQAPQRRRLGRRRPRRDFAFKAAHGMDVIGIAALEVTGATDLPRWRNMMHTSFDMDPFTIVAFGRKVFRTRVCRHTLNPLWNEKLLFHVHRSEAAYHVRFAVYDWDNITANDYVGEASLAMSDLVDTAPKPDARTGLYREQDTLPQPLVSFALPLKRATGDEAAKFGTDLQPTLQIRATYTPYEALRQRFWRELLRTFDTSDTGTVDAFEMHVMLRSLGSTLTQETLAGFFRQFDKSPDTGELTYDEAVQVLEEELQKPRWERRHSANNSDSDSEHDAEPQETSDALAADDREAEKGLQALTDPSMDPSPERYSETSSSPTDASAPGSRPALARPSSAGSVPSDGGAESAMPVERVIRLQSCPLCNMPRLSKADDMDIITHLAVCAARDWHSVNDIAVSNFITANQAHRKWYTNVLNTISQGNYRVGANNANILVHDRATGHLVEEKMLVYVRLGIRLLYQGAQSHMAGARVQRMLRNMTVKQGDKFDQPSSVRSIARFLSFHAINMDEVAEPLDSFRTFNEFFCRRIRMELRPLADPEDPRTLVSCADCRLMAFPSVSRATQFWIKGRDFSLERLLGETHARELDKEPQALMIFRLAPQDYHRFHSPVDGVVGTPRHISGQYYTVNPMAIRSAIDVYGEKYVRREATPLTCSNRVIIPIHSDVFGTVYAVAIGAMMVGSIVLSVEAGQRVRREDELGYFKFGGSTIVLVMNSARVRLDQDLCANSEARLETLVLVGSRIARARAAP